MENNVFFSFVETYWDDIAAFIKALAEWVQSIMAKINGNAE